MQLNQAAFETLAQLAEVIGVAGYLAQQLHGLFQVAGGAGFAVAQAVQRLAQLVLYFLGVLQLLHFLFQRVLVFGVEAGFFQLIQQKAVVIQFLTGLRSLAFQRL